LNEFADMTVEEYKAQQAAEDPEPEEAPPTSVLSAAVEASQAQWGASDALSDAADSLLE